MDKSSGILTVFFLLLFAGVLIAGCSSDSPSSSATAQASVTTAAASSGALFATGDIIKNPKSTSATALLIINYDAGTDMYERAYIYPNSDGTWGYRMDSKTEKISRSLIEKVYTQKVGTKSVSAVPVSTPTPAVTATEVYTTKATTAASVTAATTTTTSTSGLPKVISVEPDTGKTGTSVIITELKGQNFVSGATVTLVKSGSGTINATNVVFSSVNILTCTFVIPSDATLGYYDVVVTNPDKQYHQFKNGFNVLQGGTSSSTTTTTTTTTTTSTSTATITSISPTVIATGGSEAPGKQLTISGTNFGSVTSVKLSHTDGRTIPSTSFYAATTTEAQATFTIPTSSYGQWTVSIVDSNGNIIKSLSNAVSIS